MELEIKFKSVAWKWILNVFLVMLLVIVVLEALFCVLIHAYFVNKVKSTAEEYAQSFVYTLSDVPAEEFFTIARNYCEKFEHKDKLEVQVLDKDGKIFVTTTGFIPENPETPEYETVAGEALQSYYIGTSAVGEKVLYQSEYLHDENGNRVGAVRWLVSLTEMNSQVLWLCVIAIAIGLTILLITGFFGAYFIASIVRPVRSVSDAARKIAMGDFDAKIENVNNSEIGELCDSINFMASELKAADNMKNDFISSVSHELRTPLTAIRGWAETAKMSIGFDESTVNKGLDVILSESERLGGLVEDLLDFSRMQSGKLSLTFGEFSIGKILAEAASMYVELARKQKVEVSFIPWREEVFCHGDANRIKQVFINVIDNALKYNQPGGQIIISYQMQEECVQITVSDTGVGIAVQDLDRVKEKFYKANKQVRGSGIGLAVADEIIKQHNGLLLVDSTEGVGTTVTIVLPTVDKKEEKQNERA